MKRSRYSACQWTSSLRGVLGTVLALATPLVAQSEIPHAVWRVQEIPFVYHGHKTRYSCAVLQMKVKQVLGAVAVHESSISPTACSMIGESSQVASMQIRVVSAALLTSETRAEVAARSSQQVLFDRLGVRRELGDEFPAQWQELDLGRQLKFESGDCEFLRQISDQVLSRLAVQITAIEGPCPVTPSRFKQPRLKVNVLTPLGIDNLRTMSDGD